MQCEESTFVTMSQRLGLLGLVFMSRAAQSLAFLLPPLVSRSQLVRMMSHVEIEQKFVTTDDGTIETRLVELGLTKQEEIVMVDWYFDTMEPILTPRDLWLRHRETKGKSVWQLKKGGKHTGGTTVYQEIEGVEAVKVAIESIPSTTGPDSLAKPEKLSFPLFDGHKVPELPIACPLVPFARIHTTRSSWLFGSSNKKMSVDLDRTEHGYTVGEVETVVEDDSKIDEGTEEVKAFLRQLLPGNVPDTPAVGKLENYLMTHRPEHYEACIRGGSIQRPT